MAAANTSATTAEPEPQHQLKYQTWVLKVSIHCKGCQRKVKRVLQAIEGVYTTEVDLKQHKVTVTGDVDADTLIRKLLKSGKYAELWPEMKPPQPKQTKDAAGVASDASDEGSDDNDQGVCEGGPSHLHNVEMATPVMTYADYGKGVPAISAINLAPLVADKLSVSDTRQPQEKPPNAAQGGGPVPGAKRKKKKKKKKSNVTFAPAGSATIDGKPAVQTAVATPQVVLPPHLCASPVGFAAAPTYQARPVYAVSYSVSQPSTSYTTTSYYAPTPANACMTSMPVVYESPASGYSSESYHIFSDENANACSVM